MVLWACAVWLLADLQANPLDHWYWRNPLPQGNFLHDVGYGGGVFVAVGDYGTIITSTNGLDWTLQASKTEASLLGITYDAARFVAVGGGPPWQPRNGSILTSTNAVDWTVHDTDNTTWLRGATSGGGRSVVFAGNEEIYICSDGQDWQRRVLPSQAVPIMTMAYGNGVFAAFGENGLILTSTDLDQWNNHSLADVQVKFLAATYAAGTFVAVGRNAIKRSLVDASSLATGRPTPEHRKRR